MKKLFLRTAFSLLLFLSSFLIGNAQWVSIPDTNFGNWLNTNGYSACLQGNSQVGWQMDTTCPAVVSADSVDCRQSSLRNITGIEYFDSLQYLNCSSNLLAVLPNLPAGLTTLNCSSQNIYPPFVVPPLPSGLKFLDCSGGYVEILPPLPNTLSYLKCTNSELDSLPLLPDSLKYLSCSANDILWLPTLPTGLVELYCQSNRLTALPVLPDSLTALNCGINDIDSLPALPQGLRTLDCGGNLLTSLPPLPDSLSILSCGSSQLSAIPELPDKLTYLWCANNRITSLPALKNLRYLICYSNLINYLPELPDTMVICSLTYNPLQCLPRLKVIQQRLDFRYTQVTCIPNRGKVLQSLPALSSLPLCNLFNDNGCESYANISGRTYFDKDSNCTFNGIDTGIINVKILLKKNGILQQQEFTQSRGFYAFEMPDSGTYELSVDPVSSVFSVHCPLSNLISDTLTSTDSVAYENDFALKCKSGFDLVAHSISGALFRAANFTTVAIHAGDFSNFYGGHCAAGIGGSITTTITGPVTYFSPAIGALVPTVTGNVLNYNIADFGSVNFNNDFNIIVQTDTNAVLRSEVCFTVSVTPALGDNNHDNNVLTYCFIVVGSFDPNDKHVYPPGNIDTTQKWLTYTVNFQNTGTAVAQHIYIADTLDPNLDASTIQLLAYSHQPLVQVNDNEVRFNFPNINLIDSNANEPMSHGYVQYKIRIKENTPVGTQIRNTAFIYFDFNAPVITNTVTNSIASCVSSTTNISAQICSGETYSFYDLLLDTSGVYVDSLLDVIGCDSLIELTLTVLSTSSTNLTATICDNEEYSFDGLQLTTAGVYYDTLQNGNGCDSVIELTLIIFSTSATNIPATICDNEEYSFDGLQLTTAGVYYDTLQNGNGCDSIVELSLTVLTGSQTNLNDSICANETYVFEGQTLSAGGVYTATYSNINGCDSVVVLTLRVDTLLRSSMTRTICEGDSFGFNGSWLTQAGIYYDTVSSGAASCDMIVTLELNVTDVSYTITKPQSNTLIFAGSGTVQWYNCNTGIVLTDTASVFVTPVMGQFAAIVTQNNCVDTSQCYDLIWMGINEMGNDGISIYPNPANNTITISISSSMIGSMVVITDVTGREAVISNIEHRIMNIELNDLASGVYFVAVIGKERGNRAVKKLVIE